MFVCRYWDYIFFFFKGDSLFPQRVQTPFSVCGIDNHVCGVVMQADTNTHIDRDELGRAETEAAFEQSLAHG